MHKLVVIVMALGAGQLSATHRPFKAGMFAVCGKSKPSKLVKNCVLSEEYQIVDFIFRIFQDTLEKAKLPLKYDRLQDFRYNFKKFKKTFKLSDKDYTDFLAVFSMIYVPKIDLQRFFRSWVPIEDELVHQRAGRRNHGVSPRVLVWRPTRINPLSQLRNTSTPDTPLMRYLNDLDTMMADLRNGWEGRVRSFLYRHGVAKDADRVAVVAKMRQMSWYMDGFFRPLVEDAELQLLFPILDFSSDLFSRLWPVYVSFPSWDDYLSRQVL